MDITCTNCGCERFDEDWDSDIKAVFTCEDCGREVEFEMVTSERIDPVLHRMLLEFWRYAELNLYTNDILSDQLIGYETRDVGIQRLINDLRENCPVTKEQR